MSLQEYYLFFQFIIFDYVADSAGYNKILPRFAITTEQSVLLSLSIFSKFCCSFEEMIGKLAVHNIPK